VVEMGFRTGRLRNDRARGDAGCVGDLFSGPAAAEGRSRRFTNQGIKIYKAALKSQRLFGGKDAGSLPASLIEYSQQHTAQCIRAL